MALNVGDKAPAFFLPTDGGGMLSLKDLKDKMVVLYFYPKDMTPGCTTEAQDFRDCAEAFKKPARSSSGCRKIVLNATTISRPSTISTLLSSRTKMAGFARTTAFGRRRSFMGVNSWALSAPRF